MSGKYQDPTEKNGPAILVTLIFVAGAALLMLREFMPIIERVMEP